MSRLLDTRQLLPEAIRQGMAFMSGEPFYPEPPSASGTLRLNFSHAGAVEARRGLEILAKIVRSANPG